MADTWGGLFIYLFLIIKHKNNLKNLFSAQVRLISSFLRLGNCLYLPKCLAWRGGPWSFRLESFSGFSSEFRACWSHGWAVKVSPHSGRFDSRVAWWRCNLYRKGTRVKGPGVEASSASEWGEPLEQWFPPPDAVRIWEPSVGRGPDTHILKQFPESCFAPSRVKGHSRDRAILSERHCTIGEELLWGGNWGEPVCSRPPTRTCCDLKVRKVHPDLIARQFPDVSDVSIHDFSDQLYWALWLFGPQNKVVCWHFTFFL